MINTDAAQKVQILHIGAIEGGYECVESMCAGPEEDIKPLLEQLKAEGVFVRD